MNYDNHPCFSHNAKHQYARIHLPVAPACNMQCKYCNRKTDCINESRPGVTSVVMTPAQASSYFEAVQEKFGNISVAGIAGPGDPFANPVETLETFSLIRKKYPDINLCVASNGLELAGYADDLAGLRISHLTVTVNAIDADIAVKIYNWARYGKRIYRGKDAAAVIIERQMESVRKLKEKNITVKINTVVIPGINDTHVAAVSEKMAALGADIQNCIPLYHIEETEFEDLPVITSHRMSEIRKEAAIFIPQMSHCARCRADAAGIIGESNDSEINDLLTKHSAVRANSERPYIAAASMEGLLVNQHLGEASALWIYRNNSGTPELVDRRPAALPGGGNERWNNIADVLKDCGILLVSGIGKNPGEILKRKGINVIVMEGLISEAAGKLFAGEDIPKIMIKQPGCGIGINCTGTGMGCG